MTQDERHARLLLAAEKGDVEDVVDLASGSESIIVIKALTLVVEALSHRIRDLEARTPRFGWKS